MTREFNRIHMTEVGSFEGGRLEIRVRCTGPYSLQVNLKEVIKPSLLGTLNERDAIKQELTFFS